MPSAPSASTISGVAAATSASEVPAPARTRCAASPTSSWARARPRVSPRAVGQGLGHHQAVGQVEVRAHAVGEDLDALERRADRGDRGAGEAEQLREGLGLGLPGARGALLLAGHRGEEGRRPGPGCGGRRRSRRPRRSGCASAAGSTSRRPLPLRRAHRPRSGRGGRRRCRPCPPRRPPRREPRRARRRGSGWPARGSAAPAGRADGRAPRRPPAPRPPSEARVPTAPPNWIARRSSRTAASRTAASSSPPSQPAARRPKVIGSACWSRVRPAARSPRWRSASAAAASPAASRSASNGSSARFATSIAAVSTTSWLVAPRWSTAFASSERFARSCFSSAGTGVPSRAVPSPSASRSQLGDRGGVESPPTQAATISSAAAALASPTSAQRPRQRRLEVEHRPQPGGVAGRARRPQMAKKTVSSGPWRWMSRR